MRHRAERQHVVAALRHQSRQRLLGRPFEHLQVFASRREIRAPSARAAPRAPGAHSRRASRVRNTARRDCRRLPSARKPAACRMPRANAHVHARHVDRRGEAQGFHPAAGSGLSSTGAGLCAASCQSLASRSAAAADAAPAEGLDDQVRPPNVARRAGRLRAPASFDCRGACSQCLRDRSPDSPRSASRAIAHQFAVR